MTNKPTESREALREALNWIADNPCDWEAVEARARAALAAPVPESGMREALERIGRKAKVSRCNGCGESQGGELADTCDACCAMLDIQTTVADALAPEKDCTECEGTDGFHKIECPANSTPPSGEREAVEAVVEAAKNHSCVMGTDQLKRALSRLAALRDGRGG